MMANDKIKHDSKTIAISAGTKSILAKLGNVSESYDDVIQRLIIVYMVAGEDKKTFAKMADRHLDNQM